VKRTTTAFLMAGCIAAGCMLHYHLYRLMLVDDVTVSNQRLQMRKWVTVLILLACFLLGVVMYVSIISDLEVDFRSLHKN
jgi:hypothetical protein